MLKDMRQAVETFLNEDLPFLLPSSQLRENERYHSTRERKVYSLFGPIVIKRAYYRGPDGGRCPMDEMLELTQQYTPAVSQLMCWAAALDHSFELASQTLERFAGLNISGRQIQRIVALCAPQAEKWVSQRSADNRNKPIDIINIQTDMTGIPVRPEELKDIKGKQPDGTAKTRQIKVGCVFSQSKNSDGSISRDPFSTTYLAEFSTPEEHANALWHEALKRGYATAKEKVFLGDGAEWIWNIATDRFKEATQIVDFYHACEHLYEICTMLEEEAVCIRTLFKKWRKRLKNNGLTRLLLEIEKRGNALDEKTKAQLYDKLSYFRKNAHRMTYRTFIRRGFFIGSGAIEGACRNIVAQRAKLSGMRWLRRGAQNVLAFRSIIKSELFDEFCQKRRMVA